MRFARYLASGWILAAALGSGVADGAMRILTYPTGLVVDELEVSVDLGPEGQPAELFLNGAPVCEVAVEAPTCKVNLGPDPHIHLLELIRDGERVDRWINRPGQEAELSLVPLPASGSSQCEAEIGWAHPLRQNPAELEVSMAGAEPEVLAGSRLVRFPCPKPDESQLLVAMAVFPDGRRVEAVASLGGFAEETSVGLHAVPLVAKTNGETACETDAGVWGQAAERIERSGFEVVIVLDPGAAYVPLRTSGWDRGRLENTTSTTKVFDTAVRQGGESSAPEPRNSWLKAKATVFDAERLWYIAPDQGLHRVNGFAAGKPNWLDLLFKFGLAEIPGKPRIADAVAASGLVAAAGPHRRAVVLLLGNNAHKRDGSRFSPRQAREYLAEVNVPLVVLRNGKRREDGWPGGLPALDMEAMSRSLKRVRESLDAQCIGWFSSEWTPNQVAAALPSNVRLAGRGKVALADDLQSVWARAELAQEEPAAPVEGLQIDRLDITAMTVVVSALDQAGSPVADLAIEDVQVLEDGEPVVVLDLSPVAVAADEPEDPEATDPKPGEPVVLPGPDEIAETKELPVAVYVNRTVGGGFDQRQALRAVADQVERLSTLGPVEVVVAEKEEVRTLAGPTRDIEALTSAFDDLAGRKTAVHAIERIRQRFVGDVRPIPDRFGGASRQRKEFGSRVTFAARTAASEEDIVISRALEQLRFWAQRETGQRAGLLVVVGAGFDEDPAAFYAPWIEKLEPHNAFELREDLRAKRKEASVNALGRELASTGWRVLTVAGQATGSSAWNAESRTDKFIAFLSNSTDAVQAIDNDFLLVDPIDAQRNLAEPSGGDVAIGPAGLDRALDQASGWYLLTYQVDRPPDGAAHDLTLEIRRPGIEVKTTEVVTAATSESQAEARVRRLLGGATDRGELEVELVPASSAADVGDGKHLAVQTEATVHFESVASLIGAGADLRVSIAVVAEGTEPTVVHRLEKLDRASAGWIYTFPVEWPKDAACRLAVTVEDIASGLWGGAEIPLPAG
ncbi:MAG: hypothetical protein OES47_05815 [Acidobacteriota bacterium]|nr:hypothetical protein [Acidobacteriota bacterium]